LGKSIKLASWIIGEVGDPESSSLLKEKEVTA